MPRTHPNQGHPPDQVPKRPRIGFWLQQLATVQKGPPRTPADAAICHSPDPGGGGPSSAGLLEVLPARMNSNSGCSLANPAQSTRFRGTIASPSPALAARRLTTQKGTS
jgi:hypothetical protein